MYLLYQSFAQELFRVLTRTFVHSLWQGLIAAFLAALIMAFTQKSSARLRYNLLGAVLWTFIASGIVTLIIQINNAAPVTAFDGGAIAIAANDASTINPALSVIQRINLFLDQNSFLITIVWAFFFLFNLIKLSAGFYSIHRIRNTQVYALPAEWKNKLQQFAQSMNIGKTIQLLESGFVKVPVTLGWLKPVILLPAGLITKLPVQEIETILLHELAHIRRKDYLINIFQRLAEAVYFFNPGFMWISSLVRQEREACCDDIVMARAKDPRHYLDALVSFQEFALHKPVYAMTVADNKQYLLGRVKRMLTHRNRRLYRSEFAALFASLLLFSAFGFIPANQKVKKQHKSNPVQHSVVSGQDDMTVNLVHRAPEKKDTIPSQRPLLRQMAKERRLVKKIKPSGIDTTMNRKIEKPDGKILTDKMHKEVDSAHRAIAAEKVRSFELKKAELLESRQIKLQATSFESRKIRQDNQLFETRKALLFEKRDINRKQENIDRQEKNIKRQQENIDREKSNLKRDQDKIDTKIKILESQKERLKEKKTDLKEEKINGKEKSEPKVNEEKEIVTGKEPVAANKSKPTEPTVKLETINKITPGNFKYEYQMTTITRSGRKAPDPNSKLSKPSRQLRPVKVAPAQLKPMPPPISPQPAG